MSTELKQVKSTTNEDVFCSQHSGGSDRGLLFQVSQKMTNSWRFESVNMTRDQARELRDELNAWLES